MRRIKALTVLLPLVLFTGLAAAQPNIWHLVNGVVHGPAIVVDSTKVGDGTAGAPSYSFASAPTTGWYYTSNQMNLSVAGTARVNLGSNYLALLASDHAITFGADVALSRGAANRLDLASGDSLYLVSGGLGVGVTPPSAGSIQASGGVTAGGNQQINFLARAFLTSPADGKLSMATNDTTSGVLVEQFTNNPTCATNCGTSPTLSGVDSSFTLTMGATGSPASGFVVTFNGTWAAAPQCTAAMGLAGMAVGKLPIVIATTTTTATFTTNGTAPANSDVYHVRCSLGQ